MKNNNKNIYIYLDKGVAIDTFIHTKKMLTKFFSKKQITPINAEYLIDGSWQKNAYLLVIPGGADLLYEEKLNGKGNIAIKNFVKEGGKYLGICAGSYYASSEIEFDKGGPLEVLGGRELAFFQGKAIGPALSYYNYTSHEGATAARISFKFELMKMESTRNIQLYHHGGGFFENAASFPEVQVLANYVTENTLSKPAIIKVSYGKGMALLSGVHFEIDPFMLNAKDPHLHEVIYNLQESNNARLGMLDFIFSYKMVDPWDEF